MQPTYEEFRKMVKFNLANTLYNVSEARLEEYLNEEDSVDVIQHQYEYSSKLLKAGEITEKIFKNGSVSAASYTLYLLYE